MSLGLGSAATALEDRASPMVLPSAALRTSVLHLIAPSEIGGAESVVRVLATQQRSSGGRVGVAAVVHSDRAATDMRAALEIAGVYAYWVRVGERAYRRERRAIAALCDQIAPDVVHSHGYRTDVIDSLYVRRHLPIVTTVHGFTGGDARNRLYQWLQCRAYGRFDAVVAVSAPLHRQLGRLIDRDRLHLLPNGYAAEIGALSRAEARAALELPDADFTVGWIGRLSAEKGADVLLDALSLPDMPAGARAVFLGDGPLAVSLRQRASQLGLEGRTSWRGGVPNAARFLSAFDVLVLSSRTEGTPMVILEAMGAVTPIIATRVGGVPDMLTEDMALLVPPESPSELARAVREVFVDREAAVTRARAAHLRLENAYSVSSWADRYEAIYKRARDVASQRLS